MGSLLGFGSTSTVEVLSQPDRQRHEHSSYILHPNLHQPNPRVVAARGNYMTLENGQEILDATGGPAVACIGHGNVDVRNAVMRQMDQFSFCHGLSWSNSAAEDLSKAVVLSTDEAMARCTIMGSGSEAVEAAIKLARQYFVSVGQPKRTHFIARRGSFHGTTLGALAVSGKVGVRKPFEKLLNQDRVSFVSTPNMYRGMYEGEKNEDFVERLAKELDEHFSRIGPDSVCAFIAETLPGSSLGCLVAPAGYFQAIRSICDKYGALLILDEVICGMGRTGTCHAWQQEHVRPDIQTVAKGLGGGYAPIAMLLMSPKIIHGLEAGASFFNHGHTYQSHSVACAAALEVQNIIERDHLLQNVTAMGARLQTELRKAIGHHPHVGDIRGRGLFWAIEFVKNTATKEPFPAVEGIAQRIRQAGLLEPHNISLYPGSGTIDGISGDHILITPAHNITSDKIDQIVSKVADVIKEVLG